MLWRQDGYHARFFIRRLASGKLLLVKHDPPNGTIYIIHNFERHTPGSRQIFMATFTEGDITAGKCVSNKARLGVLINRATGKKVLDLAEAKLGAVVGDGIESVEVAELARIARASLLIPQTYA